MEQMNNFRKPKPETSNLNNFHKRLVILDVHKSATSETKITNQQFDHFLQEVAHDCIIIVDAWINYLTQ